MKNDSFDQFRNRVRLRVCGLCRDGNGLLMIKHRKLGPLGELWIPPGGGVDFGKSLTQSLEKEFLEETGLRVEVGDHLFTYEYIDGPLHAVEFFFEVANYEGQPVLGYDPELPEDEQIMEEVLFLSFETIDSMDKNVLHGIFKECQKSEDVFDLRGLFKFKKYA